MRKGERAATVAMARASGGFDQHQFTLWSFEVRNTQGNKAPIRERRSQHEDLDSCHRWRTCGRRQHTGCRRAEDVHQQIDCCVRGMRDESPRAGNAAWTSRPCGICARMHGGKARQRECIRGRVKTPAVILRGHASRRKAACVPCPLGKPKSMLIQGRFGKLRQVW
jgi:hypothetical protein